MSYRMQRPGVGQVTAAQQHSDAVHAMEIGGTILATVAGSAFMIHKIAKHVSGVDSFWRAKPNKKITYLAVGAGLAALEAFAIKSTHAGSAVLSVLP